jgi:hypothetical protein
METTLNHKSITAQTADFPKYGIEELLLAKLIYLKNATRDLIASPENWHASMAILAFFVYQEGNLNRIAYYEHKTSPFPEYHAKQLQVDQKFKAIFKRCGKGYQYDQFLEAVRDMALQRNAIVHGHIYEETTIRENGSGKLISHNFERIGVISPDESSRVAGFQTKQFKLTIVPTQLSFLDGLRVILMVKEFLRIARQIWPGQQGRSDGRWHIAPIYFLDDEIPSELQTYLRSIPLKPNESGLLEDWIEVACHQLRSADAEEITAFNRKISIQGSKQNTKS